MACEIAGPEHGTSVVLLHGWPDDPRTWDEVLPDLHSQGMRTIVPYLRGCGPTGFHESTTMRSGQLSALGQDVMDLADAMRLGPFAIIGHDWGARAAYIAASQRPGQVTCCVAVSVGYGTNDPNQSMTLKQIRNYWYHWYLALDRGALLLRNERRSLTRFVWETWSPTWHFSDAEFEATATSFENPDWADVVLHSYRHRWGLSPGDPFYDALEAKLTPAPPISVPTLVIHGGGDACNDPVTSEGKEAFFIGRYERRVLSGVGHFPQREAPSAVAAAIVQFMTD